MNTNKTSSVVISVFFTAIWIVVLVSMIVLANGCSTMNGIGADFEMGGRMLRESTQNSVDLQKTTRINKAYAEEQRDLRKAAELVLADK